jgi:hypothetical protein
VNAISRPVAARAAAFAAAACQLLAAGCAGRLADLAGPRGVTEWVTPEAVGGDAVAEVPAAFVLRNSSLGAVRVESAAVPVSTEVRTDPPLPATVGAGKSLRVTVTARFRASDGDAVRRVRLETAGQPPLELSVEARIKPVPPSDSSGPAAVGSPGGAAPAGASPPDAPAAPAPVSPPAPAAAPPGPG